MASNTPSSAGADRPKKEPDEAAARELFSQACQMFRHFVNMRYYTFTICGVITAVLATIYFQQLPSTVNAESARYWIRACGAVVAVVCGLFDWRLNDLLLFYEYRMNTYSAKLGDDGFGAFPASPLWVAVLRVGSVTAYGVCLIAWVVFAGLAQR
jgi:hypothetical protein